MKQIADALYTFTGLPIGRVYLIRDKDGATLIDTSVVSAGSAIVRQLRAAGVADGELKRILITHAHPDHIGALPALVSATGAEVWAGRLERPVIEGNIPIPTPPRETLRGLAKRMLPKPTFMPGTAVHRELADGERLSGIFGGLEVLHTPGHAPGHLAFWQPERRVLFCGDVMMRLPGLRLPFAAFTVDMAQNIASAKRLAALSPELVCFGHGLPLRGGATAALRRFTDNL